jgi:hypothetical protein
MKPIGLNLGIVFQSFHCSAKEKEHNQDINYSVFNDRWAHGKGSATDLPSQQLTISILEYL